MVVILTNIPTPYRIPLFNLVAAQLESHQERLHVLFAMPTYRRRQWENVLTEARFDHSVMKLPALSLGYEHVVALPYGLPKKLNGLRAKCLVVAGFNLMAMLAARHAQRHHIPYLVWSGETNREAAQRRGQLLRARLRQPLTQHAAGFIAYGSQALDYLRALGADQSKIKIAINCVDTDFFQQRVADWRRQVQNREQNRTRLLFVGHLQRRKGLEFFLQALAKSRTQNVSLDIVGDGPERESCQQLAAKLNLSNVTFHGFKQKEDLPKYYAAADIFVFPSLQELFGLVMVEAAAARLPIIASEFAGGATDVVEHGKNGYLVNPTNVEALAKYITELAENPAKRRHMGEQSLAKIKESVNIHKSAQGFVQAILSCLPGNTATQASAPVINALAASLRSDNLESGSQVEALGDDSIKVVEQSLNRMS